MAVSHYSSVWPIERPAPDARELTRALVELQQLQRELIERRLLRRTDGLERVREAVRQLGEVGSPDGVIARAAAALGDSSEFDRVLVSALEGEALRPVAAWSTGREGDGLLATLAGRELRVDYPLVEAEVAHRREPVIVDVSANGQRAHPALQEALRWETYVVATIELEGNTVGLLHASRDSLEQPLDDIDLAVAVLYSDGLARAFERAVLRDKLQRQRRQLQAAAGWLSAQTMRLSSEETPRVGRPASAEAANLEEVLTRRELEVLALIARGRSNRAIAGTLVLAEGTVKYHVKNILRKLQVRSRAEAVSRYMSLGTPERQ